MAGVLQDDDKKKDEREEPEIIDFREELEKEHNGERHWKIYKKGCFPFPWGFGMCHPRKGGMCYPAWHGYCRPYGYGCFPKREKN